MFITPFLYVGADIIRPRITMKLYETIVGDGVLDVPLLQRKNGRSGTPAPTNLILSY